MRRLGVVLALIVCPVLVVAQVVVTPSGWATTAGPAYPMAQPNAPLVVTPEIQLGTYTPSPAGATNATGNNPAGATNATINNVTPVAGSTQMSVQYSLPYPSVVGVGGQYAPEGAVAVTPSGVSTQLPYFDRGAARFSSTYDIGTAQPTTSLGEVAREWRQKKEAQNARTFTNEDINRIDQQYGPPTGGTSATAVNTGAAATGTSETQAPANVGTSTTPPGRRSPFTPPPQVTAPAQPSTPPPQQQAMAQYQPPMQASGQAPSAGGTQQQQPAPSEQGRLQSGTLPRTASEMPTFLIIGGVALLAGMLLRRRNQKRSGVGF